MVGGIVFQLGIRFAEELMPELTEEEAIPVTNNTPQHPMKMMHLIHEERSQFLGSKWVFQSKKNVPFAEPVNN